MLLAELEDEEKILQMKGSLTALCLDAETVFKALVWVGAGDDLRVGAAHVHVPLTLDDVAAIAL